MISVRTRPAPHAVARSGLATAEIMAGTTLAHTLAGGALPSAPWLLGAAALVFVASVGVIRHRARIRRVVPGVLAAQLLLHGFLTTTATGSAHDHMSGMPLHLTWQMLVAHAASALLTTIVWRVRRRLLATLLVRPTPALVLPRLSGRVPHVAPGAPRLTVWDLGAPRRGPPGLPSRA